ncbi:MAG: acyl-CoA synthetase [Pirellulales bacterium]
MRELPIIERASAHGARMAIRSPAGTSTYGELVASSATIAATLLDGHSDLQEARIAYLIPAGERYVQAQWGIWRAGGIAVPLGTSATEKELEYVLTDSQTDAVIVASELAERIAAVCDRLGVRMVSTGDRPSATAPLPEVDPNRRAMILYTSGTTSRPKGVVTTHACIQAQIETLIAAWRWQPNDRIPLFLPVHHIHGIINIMSCALWSGAEVEAFPKFDLDAVLRRVAERAYSLFMAVPTIYVKLIERLEDLCLSEREPIVQGFSQMRLMVSGSAALPASVHDKWRELTGQELLERYGMTEIGMALANPYDGERRPGTVGQPLNAVEIRLQGESGELVVGEGVAGEIQVRGPGVFKEYWNRADATGDSFVDGWFRTCDIGVIEDGYYRILGRRSVDIIKSGGYKLSALEIESCLLDHPAIAQCAVVGVPDGKWGEVVATAVVLKAGESLDAESLHAWCVGRISHYKIPYRLLVVEELPRNAMGKVEKRAIARLFYAVEVESPK